MPFALLLSIVSAIQWSASLFSWAAHILLYFSIAFICLVSNYRIFVTISSIIISPGLFVVRKINSEATASLLDVLAVKLKSMYWSLGHFAEWHLFVIEIYSGWKEALNYVWNNHSVMITTLNFVFSLLFSYPMQLS